MLDKIFLFFFDALSPLLFERLNCLSYFGEYALLNIFGYSSCCPAESRSSLSILTKHDKYVDWAPNGGEELYDDDEFDERDDDM